MENQKLKLALNLTRYYKKDELYQYGRKENIQIDNVKESTYLKDDGEDVLFKVADALKIEFDQYDIQRVHRLGKKTYSNAKHVQSQQGLFLIINEFMFEKSNLKQSLKYGVLLNTAKERQKTTKDLLNTTKYDKGPENLKPNPKLKSFVILCYGMISSPLSFFAVFSRSI